MCHFLDVGCVLRVHCWIADSPWMILADSVLSTPGECVHSRPFCSSISRLTAEIGIPIVLRTSPHTRDPNLDDVSVKFFISDFLAFDLMPERQRMDWFYSGMTAPIYPVALSSRAHSMLWFSSLGSLRAGFVTLATSSAPCSSPGRCRGVLFRKTSIA